MRRDCNNDCELSSQTDCELHVCEAQCAMKDFELGRECILDDVGEDVPICCGHDQPDVMLCKAMCFEAEAGCHAENTACSDDAYSACRTVSRDCIDACHEPREPRTCGPEIVLPPD